MGVGIRGAIAHLLIPDKPTPTVEYEAIYQLHNAAERLVVALYKITDRGQPDFPSKTPMLAGNAKVFWDTYFAGMRASQR